MFDANPVWVRSSVEDLETGTIVVGSEGEGTRINMPTHILDVDRFYAILWRNNNMGFLDKLGSLLSGSKQGDDAIHLYVQCDKCGAKLDIRVHRKYDLLPDYEGEGTYFLGKDMLDDKCFTLMHARVHFDREYNIIASEVDGGHLISREEYEAGNA